MTKMAQRSVFAVALLLPLSVYAANAKIECPILECTEELEEGVCFQHDGSVPTQKIKGRLCYD